MLKQSRHFEDSLKFYEARLGKSLGDSEHDYEQKGYDNGCNEDGKCTSKTP